MVKLVEWTGQPDIRPVSGRLYELQTPYIIIFKRVGCADLFVLKVPAGFRHDGASIPRVLWSIIGMTPDGLNRAGALVHDYLYRYKGFISGGDEPFFLTRKQADQLFLQLMEKAEVSPKAAWRAYLGVRLFGWFAWRF